jgi:hypothetical protein
MQALGARASQAFTSHPGVRARANTIALDPARIEPDTPLTPDLSPARVAHVLRPTSGFARSTVPTICGTKAYPSEPMGGA